MGNEILELIQNALWGWHVLTLILAVGVYFSVSTGFYQLRRAGKWLKGAVAGRKETETGGVTQFQALTAALAGSIGTGNIAGVAVAITVGGPGALFWMWVSALFGMMTVFAENLLSAKYREKAERAGEQANGPKARYAVGPRARHTADQKTRYAVGPRARHTAAPKAWYAVGPLRYIESLQRWGRPLAVLYAAGCCLSSFGMGNMAQTNCAAVSLEGFGIPPWVTGLLAGVFLFFVARGGLRFAVRITEKLVPAMTLLFFAASLGVLWVFRDNLPGAVGSVFQGAFSLQAGAGGGAGALLALRTGVSRGVFTNEAGLGSSAFAYEDVRGRTPEELGCMGIFQVFVDTLVMCTVTGLCILCCRSPMLEGAQLTFFAYGSALGPAGEWAVSLCTALFALATVVSWCCYGREGLFYLTGGRGRTPYALAAAAAGFLGCVLPLSAVFQIGDAMNGLMALPNIAALFLLRREVGQELKRGRGHKF